MSHHDIPNVGQELGILQEGCANFFPGASNHCACTRRKRRRKIGCKADVAKNQLLSHVRYIDVLYVDNHLLAAVKPAGKVLQPDEINKGHFLDDAKRWIKSAYQKPGNVFLEPIHRLDKPVSGIVLFARTSKALSRLQALMREKKITKTYVGFVEGRLPSEEGVLEHFLIHGSHRASIVSSTNPKGKCARLHYRVLKTGLKKTLVEISLETGRYHQIRAQFAHIGCPILGDCKYGSQLDWKENAIALHHAKMTVKHPILGHQMTFEDLDFFERGL